MVFDGLLVWITNDLFVLKIGHFTLIFECFI